MSALGVGNMAVSKPEKVHAHGAHFLKMEKSSFLG